VTNLKNDFVFALKILVENEILSKKQ
jgi:hypothetical protein